MRTHNLLMWGVALLFLPAMVFSQPGEIPITTSSTEAKELFIKGRDKQENIELESAAALLEQAIQKDQNFALAYFYRAFSGGGPTVTNPMLEKAVSLVEKVSPGEKLIILAFKANSDGDRETYKKHLDELLKMYPNDKRARYFMANYYNGIGDYENSIPWFKKVIESDKNFVPVYNTLGYAYKVNGRYNEAEDAFKKYIELAPNLPNPLDSYAELLLKMGRYDESGQYYQKAMDKDPTFVTPLRGIGLSHQHKGDFTKAREYFEKYFASSQQVNGKLDALSHIMYSYMHQGDKDGTVKAADRHLAFAEKEKASGNIVGNHFSRAVVGMNAGKIDEVAQHLEHAKGANGSSNLSPGTKAANDVNIGLLEADMLSTKKDFAGAKKVLEQTKVLIDKRGSAAEARNYYTSAGYFEIMQGSNDKALELLGKGNPDNPLNIFRTAMAYEQKGDKSNAKKWYKAAANWNWTGLWYAVTRPQAMKKAI